MAGGPGSARSTSAPTTAATSSHARSAIASASACSSAPTGTAASSRSPVGGERDRHGALAGARALAGELGRAVAQGVGEQLAQARRGLRRRGHAAGGGELVRERLAQTSARRRTRRARPRRGRRRRRARAASRRSRWRADLLDLDPRGLLEREAADAGAERDEREAARAELVGELRAWRRWRGG